MMRDLIEKIKEWLGLRKRIIKLETEQKEYQQRIKKLETELKELNSRLDRMMDVVFVYVHQRVDSETAIAMREAWENSEESKD